jgi:transcription factor E
MQKKFLEEVMVFVAGKPADQLVDLLSGKKNVNEFLIAKKLEITINQTRNLLYKLSDQGLVSSIRKKDKKKGWYTYFWTIENLKCLQFLKNELKRKLEQFNSQIKSRETKIFYICKKCNIELTEENALLKDFTCNECGEVFSLKDNTKLLKEMKKNKEKILRALEEVEEEIKKETEQEEKRKLKLIKLIKSKAPKKEKKEKVKKIPKKQVKEEVKKKLLKKSVPKKKSLPKQKAKVKQKLSSRKVKTKLSKKKKR